jgi:cupin fold WbuC family metalloprotein
MEDIKLPSLTEQEINEGIQKADATERRRYPKILHKQGDEFNEVVNFMMADSYMQPHLHPGAEKIEKIYLLKGRLAILYFDDVGAITKCTLLEKEGVRMISVPAFTWHTYVILSDYAITYETMMGKYDPQTWKNFFNFAPAENTHESLGYLLRLKELAISMIANY